MPDDDPLNVLRGALLRAWRDDAGISAAEFARRMTALRAQGQVESPTLPESGAPVSGSGTASHPRWRPVSPQLVSGWERGREPINRASIAQAAEVLPGGRGLMELWQAIPEASVLRPQDRWWRNFGDAGGGRVWAWLRVPDVENAGPAIASLWWGEPLQGDCPLRRGTAGVLVQFPVSVANPGLEIRFDLHGGWASFGQGEVPARVCEALGIEKVDARRLHGAREPRQLELTPGRDGKMLGVLRPVLFGDLRRFARDQLRINWELIWPHLGLWRSDPAPQAKDGTILETRSSAGGVAVDSEGLVVSQFLLTAAQLHELRTLRGFQSREQVESEVAKVEKRVSLGRKWLEHLELDERFPDRAGLISALNSVYQADGSVGIERTALFHPRPGGAEVEHRVEFPNHYVGPVWVQARGVRPAGVATVTLTWGPWRRRQKVRSGVVLTTRKAEMGSAPLLVNVPGDWFLAVGTGAPATALDINRAWHPASPKAAYQLIKEGYETVRRAWEDTPREARPRRDERRGQGGAEAPGEP